MTPEALTAATIKAAASIKARPKPPKLSPRKSMPLPEIMTFIAGFLIGMVWLIGFRKD